MVKYRGKQTMKTIEMIKSVIGENVKYLQPKTKFAANALEMECVNYEKQNDIGWTCDHIFSVEHKGEIVKLKLVHINKTSTYNLVKIK